MDQNAGGDSAGQQIERGADESDSPTGVERLGVGDEQPGDEVLVADRDGALHRLLRERARLVPRARAAEHMSRDWG